MRGGGMNGFIRSSMMYGANAPISPESGRLQPERESGAVPPPQGKMPTSVPPQSRSRVRGARPQSYYEGASSTQFGSLVPASVGSSSITKAERQRRSDALPLRPDRRMEVDDESKFTRIQQPCGLLSGPNQYAAQAGAIATTTRCATACGRRSLGSGTYR